MSIQQFLRWLIVVSITSGYGSKEDCDDSRNRRKDQHFGVESKVKEIEA